MPILPFILQHPPTLSSRQLELDSNGKLAYFHILPILLAVEIGAVHTNPKRKRGSDLVPRLRFGLVWIAAGGKAAREARMSQEKRWL